MESSRFPLSTHDAELRPCSTLQKPEQLNKRHGPRPDLRRSHPKIQRFPGSPNRFLNLDANPHELFLYSKSGCMICFLPGAGFAQELLQNSRRQKPKGGAT